MQRRHVSCRHVIQALRNAIAGVLHERAAARSGPAMIDRLEPRRMFSSWTVDGTPGDDTIVVSGFISLGLEYYHVTLNGVAQSDLGPGNPAGNSMGINAGAGNDTIQVLRENFDDAISVH